MSVLRRKIIQNCFKKQHWCRFRFYMEGIVTTGCTMDFTKYPYDSHRCKYIMGSTGFADSLMRFDSTFSFSESAQRPLQYTVRFQTTYFWETKPSASPIGIPIEIIEDFSSHISTKKFFQTKANRIWTFQELIPFPSSKRLGWVINGWCHGNRSAVYGPELRCPCRWRKCKQTAQNDTFYRFRWHHPLITQLNYDQRFFDHEFLTRPYKWLFRSIYRAWEKNILHIFKPFFSKN